MTRSARSHSNGLRLLLQERQNKWVNLIRYRATDKTLLFSQQDSPKENDFIWSDGGHLLDNRWKNGSPNTESGLCVKLNSGTGHWEVEMCGKRLPSVCEYSEGECQGRKFCFVVYGRHFLWSRIESICLVGATTKPKKKDADGFSAKFRYLRLNPFFIVFPSAMIVLYLKSH